MSSIELKEKSHTHSPGHSWGRTNTAPIDIRLDVQVLCFSGQKVPSPIVLTYLIQTCFFGISVRLFAVRFEVVGESSDEMSVDVVFVPRSRGHSDLTAHFSSVSTNRKRNSNIRSCCVMEAMLCITLRHFL